MTNISEHFDFSNLDYLEEDLDLCHAAENAGVNSSYPLAVPTVYTLPGKHFTNILYLFILVRFLSHTYIHSYLLFVIVIYYFR